MVASGIVQLMVFFRGGPIDEKMARIALEKAPTVNQLIRPGGLVCGIEVPGFYRIHDTPVNSVALKMLAEGKEPIGFAVTAHYEEPEVSNEAT